MTKRVPPYSPEVRARAVRMVLDHQGEHASQGGRIRSIAEKIGCSGDNRIADLGRRLRCRECHERGKMAVGVRWRNQLNRAPK